MGPDFDRVRIIFTGGGTVYLDGQRASITAN